ncbi:DNA repair protein RadA [Anaerovoracaceae bacterium 41-7]|uniref:DNA repair protein RadA n=2 Tax=Oscillospiraceae TaxID=216572 RepID=A0A845QKQ6_9FIRM|nr:MULTISPECIES: DNA repair protein RadA [Eubacteriales]NBH62680.1 DNA repair protein RadA [Anaerotruncus colihominis]NCF03335.1 DNA repair protein RadA [Anaerotruncus sp. 80]
MAKKAKTVYVCQECGYESSKWVGQCICGAWNSMVEEKIVEAPTNDTRRRASAGAKPSKLKEIGAGGDYVRIDTGIGELNRVLGGGLVKGSLTLISGEPGIGKSTMIIQAAANLAKSLGTVLYISGEESEAQIKMRADRVCGELNENLYILAETNMENIVAACENLKPKFLIIDSIQTMYTQTLDSVPGSVSQVRDVGNQLMKLGKTGDIPVFIVAHVTKNGELAGPKIVEHLVDCVLNFTGERDHDLRILRVFKNRFGTTSEIGAFQMEEGGLREIKNLSATFLESTVVKSEGSVITAVYEGSRPVLFEIQALTAPANVGFARRTAVGVDHQRLSMILAVLEKKAGITMINQDVYVNVVGGMRPDSTSIDLGVALAVYSSMRGVVSQKRVMAIGEVGLTGDLRSVQNAEKIVMEAVRMGYEQIILPKKNADRIDTKKLGSCSMIGAENIYQAIDAFRGE